MGLAGKTLCIFNTQKPFFNFTLLGVLRPAVGVGLVRHREVAVVRRRRAANVTVRILAVVRVRRVLALPESKYFFVVFYNSLILQLIYA